MTRWLAGFFALLKKEARLELRGKETATLLFCNAMLCAALVGVGASSAFLDAASAAKIFPAFLWITFLLSVSVSSVRAHEQEAEGRGFEGVILAGATGPQMYLAKLVVASALCFGHFVILSAVIAGALNQDVWGSFLELCLVGLGASTAVAGLLVVLSAVAGTARLRGVILPVIALPLLFPVFFSGVELTSQIVTAGAADPASPWPSILACANALYIVIGANLFEHALRD